MNIAITGSSGLVGSKLVSYLSEKGINTNRILRLNSQDNNTVINWHLENGDWDTAYPDGLDCVVHLAGENIAGGKWTKEKKDRIFKSRVDGTRLLCEIISKLSKPPRVLVCASAIGFYGDRGDEILDEDSSNGTGFLSEVCQEWEKAANLARQSGIRVVNLRFGMILSTAGGALAKMLFPFKLGFGGRFGNGNQYMSWVTIDDVAGIIHHTIITTSLKGAVNAVSPNPVTNKLFTKTLGRILKRPTFLPMPGFAARLVFGEMANELLLSSARVIPTKLKQSEYTFKYPDLERALRHLLQNSSISAN